MGAEDYLQSDCYQVDTIQRVYSTERRCIPHFAGVDASLFLILTSQSCESYLVFRFIDFYNN